MRVLYFMNHVDQGGAALALYDLIVELKKTYGDFYPIVVTGKKNKLNEMLGEIGVENYYADYKNFLSSYREPFLLTKVALMVRYEIGKRKGIKQIEDVIDFSSIDIIHSNLNRIDVGAILAAKHGIVHLWHIREHADIFSGILRPQLVTGESDTKSFNLISVKQNPIKYMSDFNLISVKGNYFIAISESVRSEWIKKGLPEKNIYLIYDGVRDELYKDVADKKKNNSRDFDNRIRMVFLGGYCKEKGQEEFLKSLSRLTSEELSNICVDFYGNGEQSYVNYVREIAQPLISKGVVRINSYDPDISSKLCDYDVGINCSKGEGFGRVTVEYMMAGLCPLASNTGASPEIVDDEETGLLYKKGSIDDLCSKLQALINNKMIIYDFGAKAQIKANQFYSMRTHASKMMELYNSIV